MYSGVEGPDAEFSMPFPLAVCAPKNFSLGFHCHMWEYISYLTRQPCVLAILISSPIIIPTNVNLDVLQETRAKCPVMY